MRQIVVWSTDNVMRVGDRLRQFWRALTQDENDATQEASSQVRLMQTTQQLNNLLQRHQLQPGIDYCISLRSRQVQVSLDSPRAQEIVRTHPELRLRFDELFACLGEMDGRAGYPCRLEKSAAYRASWKRASGR
ncbi:hypothetical protein [Sodalinema gerasimenkoae]|uniref:hypothetical protein n=1 Tax=Sodalinema gerasimenkoae TaxID=2862348 RepID=UPI00135702F1|nr:hypothetical protein [Sodalinema gerasimenkoae]